MQKNTSVRFKWSCQLSFTALSLMLLVAGCQGGGESETSNKEAKSKLPKMKFHRPKTALLGAKRLRELHQALTSEAELPEPVVFSIVEIIHGEGSSAHSHFYLESKWNPENDEPEHEGMKETKVMHKVEVDLFTEMSDIAKWLPNIAAAGDFGESDWNEINKNCKALKSSLEKCFGKTKSDSDRRKNYRDQAETNDKLISSLESVVKQSK